MIPAEAGVGLVGSLSRDLFYASLSLGSFGLMMTLDLADLLEIQNGTLIQIMYEPFTELPLFNNPLPSHYYFNF